MNLLDYLTGFLDCNYMSDLRYIEIDDAQAAAIGALEESDFPFSAFNEAAMYILDRREPFSSFEEARRAIIERMSRRGPDR